MFHPLLFTYITSNSNISILPDFVTKCKTTKGDSVLKGDSDFPKVTPKNSKMTPKISKVTVISQR